MIARFWDALFDYGDMLHEQGREDDHKVLEEVYDILQRVYDNGIKSQMVIKDKMPESKLEEFVLSIKDIIVYQDGQDFSYYYDLDGHHFDTPEEVMNYLVAQRLRLQVKAMNKARNEIFKFIEGKIDEISIPKVVGKSTPKTVVRTPLQQILTEEFLRKEFVENGRTMEEIAKKVGCSDSTVNKYVKQFGLKKERKQK